ncbi:putative transporter [Clostridium sp. CAG:780]|nr:putative transporter [Clostridium sp. CAG:780]
MAGLPIVVKYLIVFFVSMVPIVELRGAIPIAESLNLNIFLYYPIAIIGNMLPVPIIYWFARKVLEWGKDKKFIGKFFTWCLTKGEKGGEKLKASAGNNGIFWALLIFVGIPLPGTGAWTGTLAASFLKLDFKTSITAVSLGVILAGIIMSLGSKIVSIFGWAGVIALIAVIVAIIIISIIVKKKKTKNK